MKPSDKRPIKFTCPECGKAWRLFDYCPKCEKRRRHTYRTPDSSQYKSLGGGCYQKFKFGCGGI